MRRFGVVSLALAMMLAAGCVTVGGVAGGVTDGLRRDDAPTHELAAEADPAPAMQDFSGAVAWDGLPSLGGVWIAHPEAKDPVRVRIARRDGGKSVDGWLFRRAADVEGPPLQMSSEAAAKLGLSPGVTVELSVEPLVQGEPARSG